MDVFYPALGLANEAGEVAGKVKKAHRDDDGEFSLSRTVAIAAELGDVLWYLSAVASDLGLSLGDIAVSNYDKIADRERRGVVRGDGDTR